LNLMTDMHKTMLSISVEVQPGVVTSRIGMQYLGADSVAQQPDGSLLIRTSIGNQKVGGLQAYQTIGGLKQTVPVGFDVRSDGTIGFQVGAHRGDMPLTI